MLKHAHVGAAAIAALGSTVDAQPFYLSAAANAIQKYDLDGSYIGDLVAPNTTLQSSSQMTVSPDGSTLYVGTFRRDLNVAVFDARTGASLGNLDDGGPLRAPSVVTFSKTGSLLVSDFSGGDVYEYDPVTRERLGVFFTGINLRNPHEVLSFGDGYLVSDWGRNSVMRFNADGEFLNTVIAGPADGLGRPLDMVLSDDGTALFVTNNASSRISVYDTSGFDFERYIGVGDLSFPEGIIFAPDGSLVVANRGGGDIKRFDAVTGELVDSFQQIGGVTQSATDVLLVPSPGVLGVAGIVGIAMTRRRR